MKLLVINSTTSHPWDDYLSPKKNPWDDYIISLLKLMIFPNLNINFILMTLGCKIVAFEIIIINKYIFIEQNICKLLTIFEL